VEIGMHRRTEAHLNLSAWASAVMVACEESPFQIRRERIGLPADVREGNNDAMRKRGKRRSGGRREGASASPAAGKSHQSSVVEERNAKSVRAIGAWQIATAVLIVICAVAMFGNYLMAPHAASPPLSADASSQPAPKRELRMNLGDGFDHAAC
jgi:hypothetical protein